MALRGASDKPGWRRWPAGWLLAAGLIVVGAVGSVATEPGEPGPTADPARSLAQLRSELDRTAFRLAILEARLADAPEDASHGGDGARAVSAAIALLNLRQQARTDRPFAADLALVRPFLPAGSEQESGLAALGGYAAGGVPSVEDLAIEFRRVRPLLQAQVAASAAAAGGDGVSGLLHAVLATVSLAEPRAPDPRFGILDQAALELERGRLAAAIVAVEGLDAPSRAIASGWLAAARIRLSLDEQLDSLVRGTLADLAAAHD